MIKNIAASIRQRLLNLAKQRNEDFNYVLTQYAMQRLLYRLSISEYKNSFLLKGAWLFAVWSNEVHRPTRDVDFLGFGSNDVDYLVDVFKLISSLKVEDGLRFNSDSFKGAEIKEDALYQGVRITGYGELAKARISVQVDIGFGDAVTPGPEQAVIPSYLDLPAAELNVYPVYSVIAEKFQAMVFLGFANSRMKDFYDVWSIAQMMPLDGDYLRQAVMATFSRRATKLTNELPNVLTEEFGLDDNKQRQWQAFLNKNRLQAEISFSHIIERLNVLLGPVYLAGFHGMGWEKQWLPEKLQWIEW